MKPFLIIIRGYFLLCIVTGGNSGYAQPALPYENSIPADVQLFWKKTREQLAAIPQEAAVVPVNEALPYKKFFITVKSLDNVTVAGYLSIPVRGEASARPWPVLVTTCGYSGNGQGVQLSECQRGYAVLQVYPRGQGISGNYFTINSDKLSTALATPRGYYYQGAYMDIIRMIDYVVTRPDIDTTRIAMVGTSQAGGISLAVTALDPRIKTVVAHVPFLCHLRKAATLPSLAKTLLDRAGANNEKAFRTLDYFDPYVLADAIQVPAFISAGGKDLLCPASTVKDVYDKIKSKKEYQFYPELPHTSCMDSYARTWVFLDRYLLNPKQ
ncbi:acetylxylan esterase [Niabella beijingensis]|uniref:acetylxylan esterase n=1 Tax=Niabella beijingensis TaxID=2872700 RepID=UPI001CBBB539|nr:acetylxylan esterase [Niabella beijingensis]MBZ4190903.1 acetylxylan esterase [Niabella beijingensis]